MNPFVLNKKSIAEILDSKNRPVAVIGLAQFRSTKGKRNLLLVTEAKNENVLYHVMIVDVDSRVLKRREASTSPTKGWGMFTAELTALELDKTLMVKEENIAKIITKNVLTTVA